MIDADGELRLELEGPRKLAELWALPHVGQRDAAGRQTWDVHLRVNVGHWESLVAEASAMEAVREVIRMADSGDAELISDDRLAPPGSQPRRLEDAARRLVAALRGRVDAATLERDIAAVEVLL